MEATKPPPPKPATALPVAIVTGTNSGVGLALTVKLAATYRVFAGMRGITKPKRAALDAALSAAGVSGNVTVTEMDVNSDTSVNKAVAAAVAACGRIDVLVNNAGYSVFGGVEFVPMETNQAMINTNLFGVIRCTKAVLPYMRKQRSGKIIYMSSVGGVWGQPFSDVYCASKFALEGMAECQAPVFRTFGVSVTTVQPGGIKTAFGKNAKKPNPKDIPAEYLPLVQSTMAAYQKSTTSQTPEQVAQVMMEGVINQKNPPVKFQTNPAIQGIFKLQLYDPSGAAGVAAAAGRFLPSKPASAPEKAASTPE